MSTFGIIGAGNIGSQVARAVLAHGHSVVIANSRTPDTLDRLIEELGPRARAATAAEAAREGDVALVAVPFFAVHALPATELDGKIVLDANNYYFERDGHIEALDLGQATTSGLVQEALPGAQVAKAFNHIQAPQITTDGRPVGTPGRRALATASDFPEAARFVINLYDELGFDAVNIGPLSESWRVERDRPAYVAVQTKPELEANLARAPRTM